VTEKLKCIYCYNENAAAFQGVEHVIPQGFGTFGTETPTLKCVCDQCNAYFGRNLDAILTRETLEGISRYKNGQFSSERRRQKRLSITLAEGEENGNFSGMAVNVDGTTNALFLTAQFQAFNFCTGKFDIFFPRKISGLILPEEIYGKPGKNGNKGTWNVRIFAPSKEEHDNIVDELHKNGIDFQPGEPFPPPFQRQPVDPEKITVPVVIEGEVDDIHKRALAKIFMNFIAKYLGAEEAMKSRWNFLRLYVRNGEGKIKARISEIPFLRNIETENSLFLDNGINIKIKSIGERTIGSIQFYNHPTYEMILIEGERLSPPMEIAYRFTPGRSPRVG
jgi:hypothetical protein